MRRNQIILDFWGDLAAEFMTFLTPTQNIDVRIKWRGINEEIEYDDEHIRLLETQILTSGNNKKIKKTLLDYMD